MNDETLQDIQKAKGSGQRVRVWSAILGTLVTTGIVASLFLANVATGQTSDPPKTGARDEKGFKRGRMHGLGHGTGKAAPIHGEFVVPKREGGYRTVAIQRGEATEVSESTITVKSEDGYIRTYAVNGDTRVNGDGRIGDMKQGARVRIMAILEGNSARAVRIFDEAMKQEMREKILERRKSMRPGSFEGSRPPSKR